MKNYPADIELLSICNETAESFISNYKSKSILEKLMLASEVLLKCNGNIDDFRKVLLIAMEISGAKYGVFNIYNKDNTHTTIAFEGLEEHIKKCDTILGFNLLNKTWNLNSKTFQNNNKQKVHKYNNLVELVGGLLTKNQIQLLEKIFNLGVVYVVRIENEGEKMGDFNLIYTQNSDLKNKKILELFANQTGLLLKRLHADKELLLRHPYLDGIFNYSKDLKFILSKDCKILDVNRYALDILECEKEYVFGKNVNEVLPASLQEITTDLCSTDITEFPEYEIEYKGLTYLSRIFLLYDKEKNSNGFALHLVDISEQKKYTNELKIRENDLLSSKSKLENIIDGTNAGTWEWNMQTGEIHINETWANIIGYSASELQPTTIETWVKLAHPEDLKKSEKQINLHIRQKIPYYDIDCRMKHKFGHWVWIHDRGQIKSYTADGKPLMMFGTHEDISKRKEQENIIKLAKESYLAIFNSVTEAIYVMDENFYFIDVNKGAEKMYQYSRNELIGKQPKDLQAHGLNDEELIYSLLNEVKNKGKSVTFDFWAVRKNGEIFPKEVCANKGVYFGKEVLIATARDILDKKNYEDRIKTKNEELKKLNSEKDKFFSILAHDLKSPFNGFLGLTQVLSEQSRELSIDDIQRIAFSLNKSAVNLNSLLENLLQWSMIKQGKLLLNRKLLSVQKTVDNCIGYFNESIQSKALNILVNIPSEIYLNADENCIKSIIRNILNNAIKFSHPNGRILITSEIIGSTVAISIKDYGIGMNKETLDNLFSLNSISKRSGTHNEKSSGLGLLLVKEFLDIHHGWLNIESTESQGSCFKIYFPLDL